MRSLVISADPKNICGLAKKIKPKLWIHWWWWWWWNCYFTCPRQIHNVITRHFILNCFLFSRFNCFYQLFFFYFLTAILEDWMIFDAKLTTVVSQTVQSRVIAFGQIDGNRWLTNIKVSLFKLWQSEFQFFLCNICKWRWCLLPFTLDLSHAAT